jgi:hypothetical protein
LVLRSLAARRVKGPADGSARRRFCGRAGPLTRQVRLSRWCWLKVEAIATVRPHCCLGCVACRGPEAIATTCPHGCLGLGRLRAA